MTDDDEFSKATPYMTVDPEADGSYEVTATGGSVVFGFKSIVSPTTVKAYDPTEYIVRFFNDTNNNDTFDAGDTIIGTGIDAPKDVREACYFAVAMTNNAATKYAVSIDGAAGNLATAAGVIAVPFKIVPQSLEGIQLVDGTDVTDTVFTYNGKDQINNINVAKNGEILVKGEDYDITFYDENAGMRGKVVDAGDYIAVVSGIGKYQNEDIRIPFTVEKLDLSAAEYYIPDFEKGSIDPRTSLINGASLTDLATLETGAAIDISQVRYQDPDNGNWYNSDDDTGHYKKLSGAKDDYQNVVSGGYELVITPVDTNNVVAGAEKTVFVNVVDKLVTDFRYGNVASASVDGTIAGLPAEFVSSKGEAYDGGLIVAFNGAEPLRQGVADGQITVDPQTATEPGVHAVVARVNVNDNYTLGGSVRDTFEVVGGDVKNADVVVAFHGKNFDFSAGVAYEEMYTGDAVIPAVMVTCNGQTLTAGAGYTVSYATNAGEAVESMVDAGEYVVTVKLADGYKFTSQAASANPDTLAFGVTIKPRALASIKPVYPQGAEGLLYTGSAIVPSFQADYTLVNGQPRTIELDASWYELHGLSYKAEGDEYYDPAESITAVGDYLVHLAPTAACTNYTWDVEQAVDVKVIATAAYADVASDAWYADEVAKASALRYVRGMGNNLFFPEADMTREQFAQVVYNMAGEPEFANGGVFGTYPTRFSDVSETGWSAKAISWASEAGVVNGTSETTFDPTGSITREQIATMLYRYAGNGAQADPSVLDEFVDGGQVSGYALDAMAWAVENGYMEGKGANDLDPQGTATRAEIAALAVRVQPEAL